MMSRTYSDLIQFSSFEERFEYLKLDGIVGTDTFGFDRYLNQHFYQTKEWRKFRNEMIMRDNGCDLAINDFFIFGKILLHHINPITPKDIIDRRSCLVDPDNVVCVSFDTHQSIHYGSEKITRVELIERKPYDTCPWR